MAKHTEPMAFIDIKGKLRMKSPQTVLVELEGFDPFTIRKGQLGRVLYMGGEWKRGVALPGRVVEALEIEAREAQARGLA